MSLRDPLFLDLESTGLNGHYPPTRHHDEVLELALIDQDGQVLLNTLVRPFFATDWPAAEATHGIRPGQVAAAPFLEDVTRRLRPLVEGRHVVIYNAGFDLSFLPPMPVASVECAMLAFAEYAGEWDPVKNRLRYHKLTAALTALGLTPAPHAHRALADAEMCRQLWLALQARLSSHELTPLNLAAGVPG